MQQGFVYPEKNVDPNIPKHQFIVADLMQGNFDSSKIPSIPSGQSLILSTEGFTNHLYDFPASGLNGISRYFSASDTMGIMITRTLESWLMSYYIQCTINPPFAIAPHYATSLTFDKFKQHANVLRMTNWSKIADDARRAYGFKRMCVIDQNAGILDNLRTIGIPTVSEFDLPQSNRSPSAHVVEMIRQINGLAKDPDIRNGCLGVVQKWAQTDNTILQLCMKNNMNTAYQGAVYRCLDQLEPRQDELFGLSQDQIDNFREWVDSCNPRASKTRFDMSEDEENRLEAEVGPVGYWRQTRDFQLSFLISQGLQPHNSLLDVGCGVLRGGLPMIAYLDPGGYTGVDIRPDVIATSRSLVGQFELIDKKPHLHVSSQFGLDCVGEGSQDFIFLFQLLYHLSDDLVQTCLAHCNTMLRSSGRIYANIHSLDVGHSGQWKDFPFIPRRFSTYERWAERAGLWCRDLGSLAGFGYPNELGGSKNHMLIFGRNPRVGNP